MYIWNGWELIKGEIQVKKCGIHLLVDDPNVMDTSGDEIQYLWSVTEFEIVARGSEWTIREI